MKMKLLLTAFVSPAYQAATSRRQRTDQQEQHQTLKLSSSSSSSEIEYQSDESNYGRGEMHLSAAIDTGDIVVYQTGTWLVDGMEVGDGGPPAFQYGLVDTLQLVWTHNCEHGVIRALPLVFSDNQDSDSSLTILKLVVCEECVEFGPEQLVAKLPMQWDEELEQAVSTIALSDVLWAGGNQ